LSGGTTESDTENADNDANRNQINQSDKSDAEEEDDVPHFSLISGQLKQTRRYRSTDQPSTETGKVSTW
jgi:hypothetical protein